MLARKIINILLLVFAFAFAFACKGSSKGKIPSSAEYLGAGKGEWLIKIDNLTIKQDIFDRDMVSFMKMSGAQDDQIAYAKTDNRTKQEYAEKLINDILVLKKAEDEKFFDTDEAKDIIYVAVRNIKMQYYLQKLLIDSMKNIPDPTAEQAKAFYDQTKEQIAQYGITNFSTETRPYINELYKRAFAEQLVQRNMVDLKDKSIIERNEAILGKPSILPPAGAPQGGIGGLGQQPTLLPRE